MPNISMTFYSNEVTDTNLLVDISHNKKQNSIHGSLETTLLTLNKVAMLVFSY